MFVDTSTVNNKTATVSPDILHTLQTGKFDTPTTLSSTTSKVLQNVQGINGSLSNNQITSVLSNASTSVSSATSSIANIQVQATNYLSSAIKSVTSTFDGAVKSLASGIDGTLSSIFKNTNIKSASTTSTTISDPVATNLLNSKTPNSSAFKTTSLITGSETTGSSGSSSQFGSKASEMIGTNLSTVLNRLNLDSTNILGKTLTDTKSSLTLGGLFADVNKLVTSVKTLPNQIVSTVSKSLSNDLSSYLGRTSSLSDSTGINVLDYFLSGGTSSLIDNTGNLITTNGDTDSTTANSILDLVRLIACDDGTLNGTSYSSTSEISSLYNLLLSLASQSGLTDIVNSLLNCNLATTSNGQTAIVNAFKSTVGTDVLISSSLIDYVSNKSTLNTDYIAESIVTNKTLSVADKTNVDYIMLSVGSSTQEAYSVKEVNLEDMFVYDYNKIAGSSSSFTDAVFLDSALTNYVNGKAVSVQSDGSIGV